MVYHNQVLKLNKINQKIHKNSKNNSFRCFFFHEKIKPFHSTLYQMIGSQKRQRGRERERVSKLPPKRHCRKNSNHFSPKAHSIGNSNWCNLSVFFLFSVFFYCCQMLIKSILSLFKWKFSIKMYHREFVGVCVSSSTTNNNNISQEAKEKRNPISRENIFNQIDSRKINNKKCPQLTKRMKIL